MEPSQTNSAYFCLEIGNSTVKFDANLHQSSLILKNLKDLVLIEKDLRILMNQNGLQKNLIKKKEKKSEDQNSDIDVKYLIFDILGHVDKYKLTTRAENGESPMYFLDNYLDIEILHNCVHI